MSEEASNPLARALWQELEGWRRAGLTHLPMPARERTATAPADKPQPRRSSAAGSSAARLVAAGSRSSFPAPVRSTRAVEAVPLSARAGDLIAATAQALPV